jgi:hypothetical protein
MVPYNLSRGKYMLANNILFNLVSSYYVLFMISYTLESPELIKCSIVYDLIYTVSVFTCANFS